MQKSIAAKEASVMEWAAAEKTNSVVNVNDVAGTESHFDRVQRMANIGTWNHDIARDHLVWSAEVFRIFEIDPETFGASLEAFMETVHPDDREAVAEAYETSLRTGIPYGIEHRLLMPDGRIKHVMEECEIMHDAGGKAISAFGTVQDITAFKSLEEENAHHKALLTRQSKMAQMGEMIDTIAHQWKQPLHQINSILPALERHFSNNALTPDQLAAKLDEIEMLTMHMAQTVESFRQFFHPKHSERDFDVADTVRDALTLIRGDLERHAVSVAFTADAACTAVGNKQEFIQVLLSILNNAKECFRHRNIAEPKLRIGVRRTDNDITVTISDNAGGIPPHLVNKIFELYFTTKIDGHGTGLGLYIAKMLVEQNMQGTITVENGPEGAVFTIFLPLKA